MHKTDCWNVSDAQKYTVQEKIKLIFHIHGILYSVTTRLTCDRFFNYLFIASAYLLPSVTEKKIICQRLVKA